MRLDNPFPCSIAAPSGAPHLALGAALAAQHAARRRWRAALLGHDLAESIAARASLMAADLEVERAEAMLEQLSTSGSN